MENFVFRNPTRILFGRGMESRVGEEARGYGKVLLHYGRGSIKKSGLYDRVTASLRRAGVPFVELGGVQPNPRLSLVKEGVALARREGVKLVLAVGGGSAIDSAKAIAMGVPYEGDVWDFFTGRARLRKALPVATILTIPAAGSEASTATVITNEEAAEAGGEPVKKGFNSELLYPRFSILNPELCFTLPDYQVGCGATDILAHLLERYFTSVEQTALTDAMLEAVMRTVVAYAPLVLERKEEYDAWAELMLAGYVAHNNSLGVGRRGDWGSHALEHELSALYDVAHGAGLAVILPAWLSFQHRRGLPRLKEWAERVWDANSPEEGIRAFKEWLARIGMPTSLSQLTVPADRLAEMASRATRNGPVGNSFPLTWEDALAVYRLAAE